MENKKEKIFLPSQIGEMLRKYRYPGYIGVVICKNPPSTVDEQNTIYFFLNRVTGEMDAQLSGQQFAAINYRPFHIIVYSGSGNDCTAFELINPALMAELKSTVGTIAGRECFLNDSIGPYMMQVDPGLVEKINQKLNGVGINVKS